VRPITGSGAMVSPAVLRALVSEFFARPPAEVFAFATDTNNATRVVKGVVAAERLTAGPLGVGSRIRETRRINDKDEVADLAVIAFAVPTS